jgi:signal transduction histidine kinase
VAVEDRPLGLVAVASSERRHDRYVHYEALLAFVERAALALQNAQLYERLQAQVQELRSLHDQIVRAERLAAIGEIAAKVAHELNNPLASIQLYNSLLLEEPVDGAEQQRLAATVLEQVERAKRVVRDILDYSRAQESHPQVIDLNLAVEQGLRLVRHVAAAGRVAILEDYAHDLPAVMVDTGQLAQVITNLTLNAVQAMPKGGTLTISTGREGEEVYVKFTDTGAGISEENQARIFEPFFTTKPTGEGTGLGLSVCRNLITRHHGRITVNSRLGSGTTFSVYLPPAMHVEFKEGAIAGTGGR